VPDGCGAAEGDSRPIQAIPGPVFVLSRDYVAVYCALNRFVVKKQAMVRPLFSGG
jgi:hypothetical protein